jgi:nucleoside-diphosphate-sugar epimerase
MFTGPPAPGQRITPGDSNALSTNLTTYNLLLPNTKFQTPSFGFVDVRDVAQSLVSALRVPGKNRVLLSGEWYDVTEAIDYIASVRPELKGRLASLEPTRQTEPMIDSARAIKILGLPGIRKWKDTVIETVDYMIALEKEWIRLGIDVDEKLKKNEWNTVIV